MPIKKTQSTVYKLLTTVRSRLKTRTLVALGLLLLLLPVIIIALYKPSEPKANWYDDLWGFRQRMNVTVASNDDDVTNLQTLITVNTEALIDAGKLQSDCDDLRFTNANGTLLPYYIDSGCDTTSTKVWILVDLVPADTTSYTMYMYYGNPGATAGSDTTSTNFNLVRGLVGYWPMNEDSWTADCSTGSVVDVSVNGNDGKSCPNSTGPAGGTTGQYANAGDFDGSDDHAVYAKDLLDGKTSAAISTWFKTSDSSGGLLSEYRSSSRYAYKLIIIGGKLGGCIQTTDLDSCQYSESQVISAASVNDDTWHHGALIYDGTKISLFVDGTQVDSEELTGAVNVSSFSSAVGYIGLVGFSNEGVPTAQGVGYLDGIIDDTRVYNRALSADEVSQLYTSPGSIASVSPATSNPTVSFATEEKSEGPVAYWGFDEGYGTTANDSTSNENDGTISGATWQTEDMCVSGKCLYFDGSDDYASVASSASVDVTGNRITLSAWVRWNGQSGNNYIFEKSSNKYNLNLANGTPKIYFSGGIGELAAPSPVSANQWHHIVATYDGTQSVLYVDGKQVATKTGTAVLSSGGALYLGCYATCNSTYSFHGFIDEPKIYNYARSAEQILQDYNKGSAVLAGGANQKFLSDGLVGYWKMDEASWTNNCSTASVIDSSGNGNNGKSCPNTTGPTGGAAGKYGNGGSFDGTDDYVSITNTNMLGSSGTTSLWINPDSTQANSSTYILNHAGTGSNSRIYIWINATATQLTANLGDGTSIGTMSLTPNTWSLITITWENSNGRLFKNGTQNSSSTYSGMGGNANITVGAYNSSSSFYNGKIDEIRIYNRALSPSEVQALYKWAPGPVGYWDFDEGEGTSAYDKSGNGNTGTITGSIYTNGKFAKALDFDGNDNVDLGSPSTLDLTHSLTISAWVNHDTASNNGYVIAKRNGAEGQYGMYINSGNLYFVGEDAQTVYTGYDVTDDKWHFLTFVISGTNLKTYINGVHFSEITITALTSLTNVKTVIGGRQDGGGYAYMFDGAIDDVKIYNYARTQEQILQDMYGDFTPAVSTGSVLPKPIAHYSFDEQTGQTVNNKGVGGSSLNGTLGQTSSNEASDPTWKTQADCKVNGCLSFDGGDFVDAGNNLNTSLSDSYSVTSWVKIGSTSGAQTIASYGSTSSSTRKLFRLYQNNGDMHFYVRDNTNAAVTASKLNWFQFNPGWHHITGVRNGNEVKLYINGRLHSSTSGTISTTTVNKLSLGADFGGSTTPSTYLSSGSLIDEVKIYNTALTEQQIKLDYNSGLAMNFGVGAEPEAEQLSDGAGDPPVAHWTFDEKQGTTAGDSSGNGNDGTISGASWTRGKVGQALSFDGVDDTVSNSFANFGSSGTIGFWINPNIVAGQTYYVFDSANATNRWLFYRKDSSSTWGIYIGGTSIADGATGCSLDTYLTTNSWHHISIVYSDVDDTTDVFIDGVNRCSKTTSFAVAQPTGLKIGSKNNATEVFKGAIDDVKIYDYARTPAQIAYDYNRGEPIAHWKFDECQGNQVYSSSYNVYSENTGTVNIGSGGTQTAVGTCDTSGTAWGNGASGKWGASLNFDGVDDNATVPSSSNLNIGTSDFTISTWVKGNNMETGDVIFAKTNGGSCSSTYGFHFGIFGSNYPTLHFCTGNGSHAQIQGTSSLQNGQWHHILISVDRDNSNNTKVFVDGKVVNTTVSNLASHTGSITNALPLAIGSESDGGFYWDGQVDDVRIYNYALSPDQIKKLYNNNFSVYFGPNTDN